MEKLLNNFSQTMKEGRLAAEVAQGACFLTLMKIVWALFLNLSIKLAGSQTIRYLYFALMRCVKALRF